MISILIKLMEVYSGGKERVRERIEKSKEERGEKTEGNEQKQRGIKRKARKVGLVVARYIVTLVEQLMLWLLAIFGFTGVIVIVFGVLIVVFLMDALAPNQYLIKEEWLQTAKAESAVGEGRPVTLQFTEEELAMYGQYYTEYEKNLFRVGILLKQSINGYGTGYSAKDILGEDKTDTIFRVMFGLQTVETSWEMFVKPSDKDSKSVYEHPSMVGNTGNYHGPYQVDRTYTLDSMAVIPSDMKKAIKEKYKKPQGTPDVNFYPYASAMSVAHLYGKKAEQGLEKPNRLTDIIDTLAPAYGVGEDLDRFKKEVIPLMLQVAYLSWHPAETEGLSAFFLGVWAMSSENPAERGFQNYQITYDDGLDITTNNHQLIQGVGTNNSWTTKTVAQKGGFRGLEFGKKRNITLNGEPLSKPLSRVVVEKYWDKPGMQKYNSQATVHSTTGNQFVVKGLYGLESYLVGDMLVRYLTEKIPYVKAADGGGFLDGFGFLEAKQGVIQGAWSEKTKQKMMSYGWSSNFGICTAMAEPGKVFVAGKTFEQWRQESKWKVPWYIQRGGWSELGGGNIRYGVLSKGNSCHVYMCAYIASALTGKMITQGEMFAAMRTTGGFDGVGYFMNSLADVTFSELGIEWVGLRKNGVILPGTPVPAPTLETLKGSVKEKVDAVLTMGGIVGVSVNARSPYTDYGHYMVITEKKGEQYMTFSATHPDLDNKPITWEALVGKNGSLLRDHADGASFFLAYNPNIEAMLKEGSGTGGVSGDISLKDIGIKRMPDLKSIKASGGGKRDVKRIVIHYTGHGGAAEKPAKSYYDWLKGDPSYGLGAQFYLDSKEILQVTPLNWVTNHTMGANNDSIGLEVSNVLYQGKYYYKKGAIENAVKLTRALMKEYNLKDIDKAVVRHYDAGVVGNGKRQYKNCPAPMVNAKYGQVESTVHPAWLAFKDAVRTGKIDWVRMESAVDPRER